MSNDFGAAGIRDRVLAAWRASPARFREDANAEEDFAKRGYADRLVYELAQNAADAAAGGVPGRLKFVLTPQALYVANTGTPITAAAIAALSQLRTSTKGSGAVGRFGVGFKAVLAVTDEPAVLTIQAGVRWSKALTVALLSDVPALAAELARRGGDVPVMRLPFAADSPGPDVQRLFAQGYDTVVVLPWRDSSAAADAAALVEGLDPTLQLFLPGLVDVAVESADQSWSLAASWIGDRVTLGGREWQVRSTRGEVPAALMHQLPVEDRERTGWEVTVALALEHGEPVPVPPEFNRTLRAPQPTDEPLSVAALVSASVPLDTARRHALSGELTDFVVGRAAGLFVDTLIDATPRPALLDMVPTGIPLGLVDGSFRAAVAARLAESALFASAHDSAVRLRPREAALIDAGDASAAITAVLAPLMPQLIDADHQRRHGALAALGVRRLDTADVVELLGGIDQPPTWWGELLAALARAPDRDALRGLRVPLADGRTALDPRGLLLPVGGIDLQPLMALGIPVRAVHPDAISEAGAMLLRALGAIDADPGALLDEPALRDAVVTSLDGESFLDPDDLATVVIGLARERPLAARERTWLAELALRNSDGELQPAGELLLPVSAGGTLAALMRADAPFGVVSDELVERFGADGLESVGVLRTFAVVHADDVSADAAETGLFLDGDSDWLASLDDGTAAAPPLVLELDAVRDLEWVAGDQWGRALAELAGPSLRQLVTEPVRLLLGDGRGADAPSYTRWWLDNHPCVPLPGGGLARPTQLRAAQSPAVLAGLYDVVPDLPVGAAELVAALATVKSVDQLLKGSSDGLIDLLERLGDPRRPLARHQLHELYGPVCTALARRLETESLPAIQSVRGVARADAIRVVAPDDAVVVDRADLLGLLGDRPVVPVGLAAAIDAAEVLEVPLASSLSAYAVQSVAATSRLWRDLPGFAAAIQRVGMVDSAIAGEVERASYDVHAPLRCGDIIGSQAQVAWRIDDGRALISEDQFVQGASRSLATLLGVWHQRNAIAAILAYPDRTGELLAEAELD